MEEEDVRGDRGLSVFRLRAVSRLTLVVRCTEIGYSVSTQVLCVVGFLFGCCWFCVLLLGVSAWWNRGTLDEVTKASFGRAVTGTAVMARSANEEKKKKLQIFSTGRATSWMAFGSHLASASAALSWPPIHSSTCVFLTLSLAPHHNSKSKVGR